MQQVFSERLFQMHMSFPDFVFPLSVPEGLKSDGCFYPHPYFEE